MAVTQIKKEVRDLANAMKPVITIGEDGRGVLPKDHVFEASGGKLDPAYEKARAEYLGDYVAAGQLAWSEVSQPVLEKNGDLKATELTTNLGRDKISWTQLRSRTGRNPQTGATTVTKGAAGAEYIVAAVRKTAPQLAAVREEIKVKFANMAD